MLLCSRPTSTGVPQVTILRRGNRETTFALRDSPTCVRSHSRTKWHSGMPGAVIAAAAAVLGRPTNGAISTLSCRKPEQGSGSRTRRWAELQQVLWPRRWESLACQARSEVEWPRGERAAIAMGKTGTYMHASSLTAAQIPSTAFLRRVTSPPPSRRVAGGPALLIWRVLMLTSATLAPGRRAALARAGVVCLAS